MDGLFVLKYGKIIFFLLLVTLTSSFTVKLFTQQITYIYTKETVQYSQFRSQVLAMMVMKHDARGHVFGCFLTTLFNLFSAKSIFFNGSYYLLDIESISNNCIGIIIPTPSNAIESQNTRLFINKKRERVTYRLPKKTTQTAPKMKIFCATYDWYFDCFTLVRASVVFEFCLIMCYWCNKNKFELFCLFFKP